MLVLRMLVLLLLMPLLMPVRLRFLHVVLYFARPCFITPISKYEIAAVRARPPAELRPRQTRDRS